MSSADTSAEEKKAGGKSSTPSFNNWAVVIFLVLILWGVIHTAHTHTGRPTAYLCTFDALKEFTVAHDADGLARISNSCAGSRVAGEARRTLWDWASADWRRASTRNTTDGYHEFCTAWQRYELTEKYYDCAHAPRTEPLPVAYKGDGWRPSRQINGEELDGEYVAQVYNGTSRDGAETFGDSLKRRHASLLGSLTVAVEEGGRRGYAREHKVLIGPLSSKRDADALCWELKNRNIDCFPKASASVLD